MNKTEFKNELINQLNEIRTKISEQKNNLDETIESINNVNTLDAFKMYQQEVSELENNLDESTRDKVNKTKELVRKKEKCKFYGMAAFVIYSLIAIAVLHFNKLSFSSDNTFLFIKVAVAGILVAIICTAIAKKPISNKLITLRSDSEIIEYEKEKNNLFKKVQDKENELKRLNSNKKHLTNSIIELQSKEKKILCALDELEFNFKYKDTILFYGKQRNNRYI